MHNSKVSFQSQTVAFGTLTLSFEMMGHLEKALSDAALAALTDPVQVNQGEQIVMLGDMFGLDINPNAEDAMETVDNGSELYQVEG